jgi:hypothetical protein
MSLDLEQLLRDTLAERAGTVSSGPTWKSPVAPARRRWVVPLAVAASVAAVLTVVGTVAAVEHGSRHDRRPAETHSSSLRPTATTSPAPKRLNRYLPSCAAALPSAWHSAIKAGTATFGATSAVPLAVTADGSQLLVARDQGSARDVALVDPDGRHHTIFSVPQPDENQVEHASVEGDYAVIDVERKPRNANGVLGTVVSVVLIDLRTDATTQLDHVTEQQLRGSGGAEGRTIDGSVLWNGHVYWDVRATYVSTTSAIHDYDIASRHTSVVARGAAGPPQVSALGVSFGGYGSTTIAIARPLPAAVAAALTSQTARDTLVTDGRSYAWRASATDLAWWAPGSAQVTEVGVPEADDAQPDAVAGPFVLFGDPDTNLADNSSALLDARTGAVGTARGLQPFGLLPAGLAGSGILVGYAFEGKQKSSPTAAVRVDTTGLPGLHC